MAPVGKHRCLPSERAPWRAALGMPIVLLLASCASTDRGELQRLADSAAGAIGASGGFLQVCDKQSEGCERWAPLFVQTVGESSSSRIKCNALMKLLDFLGECLLRRFPSVSSTP